MNLMTLASLAITGSLLATLHIGSIPYTVALSPATITYQQTGIEGVSSVTESPYNPVVNPYRTTGSPIILGGGGTQVYLQPELPAAIKQLPAYAIVSAELRIPMTQQAASTSSGSVLFGAYQISSNWSQGSSTYFREPTTSSAPFSTDSLFYDAQSARSSGFIQTLNFDVTWIVREWVSGTPNYGIMIQELNPAQTAGLWWQAPFGEQPEIIVTVQRDYLPVTTPSENIGSTVPDPSSGNIVVGTQPVETRLSWGGGAYGKAVSIQTGSQPVESFTVYGLQGELELKIDRLETQLSGGIGVVTQLVDPNRTLPPKEGVVGEFTLLGSVAFPLGGGITMLPGLGLFIDSHTLTFGSSADRLDHNRTLSSLFVSNEWRYEPTHNTYFSARIAASPLGNTQESFTRTQGVNWVKQTADSIFATWIEGSLSAKLRLLPHTQLTMGYTASTTFVPEQWAEVIYTDSNGMYIPGSDTIDRAVTNTSRGYIGLSFFF